MRRLSYIASFFLSFTVATAASRMAIALPIPVEPELKTPFMAWTESDDFTSNEPHDPIVVNDNVVVGTDRSELRAYRCEDGKRVWTYEQGQRVYHRPSTDGERIYCASARGVTAVAAADGKECWVSDSAFCDGGPILALPGTKLVYVGGSDGNVYAIDAKTGANQWTSDFIADAPADPPNFPGERARLRDAKARPSQLTSDGAMLFLSVFDQCRVVAIDAASGKRVWSFQTGGWVYGAAVAAGKYVFVGSQDKSFYCLDKKTGKQIWKHPTKGRIESGCAADFNCVYFGSCDGNVYCLNQSDGAERWQFAVDLDAGKRKSAIYSTPILRQSGVCIAAGEGQTYMIDRRTGKLIWKIRPAEGSELYCSPAIHGNQIFVVSRKNDKLGKESLAAIGLK